MANQKQKIELKFAHGEAMPELRGMPLRLSTVKTLSESRAIKKRGIS